MECQITEEQLWSLIDRADPELEVHLLSCPKCSARANDLQQAMQAVTLESDSRSQDVPDRIGDYKVIRVIGEGGMARVYEAEQREPNRPVALKVLKGTEVDDEEAHLFRREIQSLGMLRHPGIAQIYEGGRTSEGRPYYSMELVKGTPINRFIREQDPSIEEILRLMIGVCRAVQYAHQRGVIHRDLKPLNLMVVQATAGADNSHEADDESVGQSFTAKILDFGLAKVTDPELTHSMTATRVGRVLGTLPYMSPEQASGRTTEVDVRTDVYALGVVLYEALLGRLPYQVARLQLLEAARVIATEPPVRPSSLRKEVRGDLELILLKALEKDKERRYASPAALADDLECYLCSAPVSARMPTLPYLFLRFVQQHTSLALMLALITIAVMGFGYQLYTQSKTLERSYVQAEKVAIFLQNFLTVNDPWDAGPDATLERMLEKAENQLQRDMIGPPKIQARVRHGMANAYRRLGNYKEAERQIQIALALRKQAYGRNHFLYAQSLIELSDLYLDQKDLADALAAAQEALAICRGLDSGPHEDTATCLRQIAKVYAASPGLDKAEAFAQQSVAMLQQVGDGLASREAATSLSLLATIQLNRDAYEDAIHNFNEAVKHLQAVRDREAALRNQREPMRDAQRENLEIASALNDLGHAELKAAQAPDLPSPERSGWRASLFLQEALDIALKHDVRAGRLLPRILSNLGSAYLLEGQYVEAAAQFDEAVAAQERLVGRNDRSLINYLIALETALFNGRDYETAKEVSRRGIQLVKLYEGPNHSLHAEFLARIGAVFQQQELHDDAIVKFDRAAEIYRLEELGVEGSRTRLANCLANLAISLWRTNDKELARQRVAEALDFYADDEAPNHYAGTTLLQLGTLLSSSSLLDDRFLAKTVLARASKVFESLAPQSELARKAESEFAKLCEDLEQEA